MSGNEANYTWGRTPMDTLLSGDSATVCIWLRLTSVAAGMKADYTNRAEIIKAYGLVEPMSIQDIDGVLNSNYGDNPGGQPGSPADDFLYRHRYWSYWGWCSEPMWIMQTLLKLR
ncbi:MAG: hypothetical protein IPO25_23020 [Saprospiraceae bacterium]|nr:hypothetical protein [Saprospiraceae bacterium]